ncbi:MAG: CRTAC1 family protein [bacterium]
MQTIINTFELLIFFLIFGGCGLSENDNDSSLNAIIFTDITERVQLNFLHDPGVDSSYFMPESIGSGGAFLDYDNDGDLDIYLVNGAQHGKKRFNAPPLRNHLFRQERDGTFVDVTEASGLGDTGYGMGVAVGDIDNDGDVDVYVTNYGYDALYRNNGDRTFTNISKLAGIGNPHWGCSVIFFDYNLDNYLDIYVTNYVAYNPLDVCMDKAGRRDYCGPDGFSGVPDVLYRNNGDGTFTDISVTSGIAKGSAKGLGIISADFNGDHYPDLYVANDGEPNHLWMNQRDGTFQDQGLLLGAALNELGRAEAGMGIALGDVENDNDFDLFITHLRRESNTFYRNAGEYGFQDDTSPAGLAGPSMAYTGFGTGFFDYDHDGDLDLAVVNGRVTRGPLLTNHDPPNYWDYYAEPNFLFENLGHGSFREVSDRAPAYHSKIENSRGLAFGDVDNDGDIDLLVTNEGGLARLFRNDVKEKGHWLIIRAIDPILQRDALGAKITVLVAGRRLNRLIAPGYSFLCSNDPRVHFGLGTASAVDQIIVQWPDGTEETFPGIEADRIITLKKGQVGMTD